MPEIYPPLEDSYLLATMVKKYARGIVLDMGTGSGIQAVTAKKNKNVISVLGVDSNPDVIKYCKKKHKQKIVWKKSDLFSNIKKVFDTIIFNPPYLPQEGKIPILELEGGKHGYELIERFLNEVNKYLSIDGQILLLISSLSNPEHIKKVMNKNMLSYEHIISEKFFFEELYVYKITKRTLLQRLEKKGFKNISYFDHGKRGVIHTALYKKKKVAIKTKLSESEALGKIENESRFLKRLNNKGIGPTLLVAEENFLVYTFVEGISLKEWIRTSTKKETIHALKTILEQCHAMDLLGISKEEMHHPHQHVLVNGKRIIMIDFERCHHTEDPQNVSQFCQYIRNNAELLEKKGIIVDKKELLKRVKEYKNGKNKKKIVSIKKLLS